MERKGSIPPPSFYEQLADLTSHVLALSTQWAVCYHSVVGVVEGTWDAVTVRDRPQGGVKVKSVITIIRSN